MATTLSLKCNRSSQRTLMVALATCIITGYIYQYILYSHPQEQHDSIQHHREMTKNKMTQFIQQHLPIPPAQQPTAEDKSPLSQLAKYYPKNILNKQKYSDDDFSFFWLAGDGSPLFVNASNHKHQHKFKSFVFCPVPKVGCTSWKQVIKRMKGIPHYLADDYWSVHHPDENQR